MAAWRVILVAAAALAAVRPAAAQPQTPAPAPRQAAPGAPPPARPAPGAPDAAPAAPAAPAEGTQTPPQDAQTPPEAYSYNPEGRRDPFVSLLVRGGERSGPEARPDGREGLLISEVTLRGIVKSKAAYMAMLQGADNKTYIVRAGDKMLDGVVKLITADAVVFAQDVNDPLSLVKQREIRKSLRVTEEGK